MTLENGIFDSGPAAAADESACRFIEALVAVALRVGLRELRASGREHAGAVFARQVAMYLGHVSLGLDLTMIGARFRRDRTTVAHACARIEDGRDDPGFSRMIDSLEAAIDRWQSSFVAGGW